MSAPLNKALLSLLAVLMLSCLGCATRTPEKEGYYAAVIERVDLPEGVFFTTKEGSAPMSYVYLRLRSGDRSTVGHLLEVQILAQYDVVRYGEPGDEVAFQSSKLGPGVKAIGIADLIDYKVIKRMTKE
ncbi:MAG TPA: hypothetical protein VGM73_00775 [Candidatus Didemnitutus sp.]|jgi:hypothetical protein